MYLNVDSQNLVVVGQQRHESLQALNCPLPPQTKCAPVRVDGNLTVLNHDTARALWWVSLTRS